MTSSNGPAEPRTSGVESLEREAGDVEGEVPVKVGIAGGIES